MSDELLLHAQGLNKQFGAVVAAQDVNVRVKTGERVSLIGSNGAGKTTFVNMITGYVRPDSGSIALGDTDISRMTPRQITRMGVARSFQIPQLYPSMTVLENMLVALACHENRLSTWLPAASSQRIQRADEVLSRFDLLKHRERLAWVYEVLPELKAMFDRRALLLSGGQQKLVALARALAVGTRLLLLDEPFEGVAPALSMRLSEVIRQLKSTDLSVLIAQSDVNHASDLLDAQVVIERGANAA